MVLSQGTSRPWPQSQKMVVPTRSLASTVLFAALFALEPDHLSYPSRSVRLDRTRCSWRAARIYRSTFNVLQIASNTRTVALLLDVAELTHSPTAFLLSE